MLEEVTLGTIVAGRYRLVRKLGEGGMGMVWSATHLVTEKTVALKMLKPESSEDPKIRARFLREARAACAVRHPNIVEIHDVLEVDGGAPCMVMDFLDGETLGERIDRERMLPVQEVARIMLPVVSAVGAAHGAGIVHRDLKPDNIFLVKESGGPPSVKVLDFGIAKVYAAEGAAAKTGGLTGTGAMLGTPYYMAPEQIFGDKDIDHRADIWALGVIFYELLAGHRPTQADNIGQIIKIVTLESMPDLAPAAPHVPRDLITLVGRMLTRDRRQRPQTLAEVFATLRRYTDVAARTFPEPASNTKSSTQDDGAARIRTGDHHASAFADTALPSRPASDAALARSAGMTTAGTSAERTGFDSPRRRAPTALVVGGAAILVAGAIGIGAWRMSAGHSNEPTSSTAPVTTTKNVGIAPTAVEIPEPTPTRPS